VEFGFKASDYLKRAKNRLAENTAESHFYAAFELRCGIEARLKEYFDAQAETTKKKREGWQISKLAKQVETAFKSRERVIRLVVLDAETKELISEAFYTPVTKVLQKLREQLGEFLHAPDKQKYENQKWLEELKLKTALAYKELEFAVSGKLMAPPLEHPREPGKTFFCLEGDQTTLFPPGKRIGMKLEQYEFEH
jgi:hypothetical protein